MDAEHRILTLVIAASDGLLAMLLGLGASYVVLTQAPPGIDLVLLRAFMLLGAFAVACLAVVQRGGLLRLGLTAFALAFALGGSIGVHYFLVTTGM
ncbi:MAG: hypothetical protein ACYDGW_08465 [Vulcanimicrobiaceae bacterium]